MRFTLLVAVALVALAPRPRMAAADPVRCQLVVLDSLTRPVPGATVTCAGLPAAFVDDGGFYLATGDVPPAPTVTIHVSHPRFLPTLLTLARDPRAVVSSAAWLRRRGELTLARGGHLIPFAVERDRLLVVLDRHDRAAGTVRSRADVLAELAPLLATWGLVEARSRALPPSPARREFCGVLDDELVLARADGAAFDAVAVPALAALRGHPRIRSAGPLVRSNPWRTGELSLGHAITVERLPAGAAIDAFARRHHATWDPATRTLRLPPSVGLAAADLAAALTRSFDGAVVELELVGQKECVD